MTKYKYNINEYGDVEMRTQNGDFVGLSNLPKKYQNIIKFIRKHRLTNIMSLSTATDGYIARTGYDPVCVGYNKKEKAWYGWSHKGFMKFQVGDIINEEIFYIDDNYIIYPEIKHGFVCHTLNDCKKCAIQFAACLV